MQEHEQAIITALAYVIGFTTAYIAFANISHPRPETAANPSRNYSAAVETARADDSSIAKVLTTAEGLFVLRDGKERIISLQSASETGPGYHRSIAAASASTDGSFVHYCAVMDDDQHCAHFIYDVRSDTVYRVTKSGQPLDTTIEAAAMARWEPVNKLLVDSAVSADAETPWIMR